MKLSNMTKNAGMAITKLFAPLKKHAPQILMAGGIAGAVGSTVLACRATLRLNDTLESTRNDLATLRRCQEEGKNVHGKDYTQKDAAHDKVILYLRAGLKVCRLYAPAALLGGLSIAGMVGSNTLLQRRAVALTAAYAAVDKGFREYRGRVTERYGADVDKELRYGIRTEKVEKTVVDEKGHTKKVKETVTVSEQDFRNEYGRLFRREDSRAWDEDQDMNDFFLRSQQTWANNRLKAQGHLFLNDVYESLGYDHTPAGAVVGWIYDPNNPAHDGDSVVDFGMTKVLRRNAYGEMEEVTALDVNVDGVIYDKI